MDKNKETNQTRTSNGESNTKVFAAIKRQAREIIEGREAITHLLPGEEEARRSFGARTVETSLILGGICRSCPQTLGKAGSGMEAQRGTVSEIREEQALREYAFREEIFYSLNDFKKDKQELEHGFEANAVLASEEDGFVYKFISIGNRDGLLKFIDDKIVLHNFLFPETYYGIEGFANVAGTLNIILKQPFIDAEPLYTQEEYMSGEYKCKLKSFAGYMKDTFGLSTDKGDRLGIDFHNSRYEVCDLHGENVLVGNGKYFIIDPQISLGKESYYKPFEIYLT